MAPNYCGKLVLPNVCWTIRKIVSSLKLSGSGICIEIKIKTNLRHENYFLQDPVWYNKNVRLKTRRYFHYSDWHHIGVSTLGDLYSGHNFVKTFEDLVLQYDIPFKDRRKYNSLMNGIFYFIRLVSLSSSSPGFHFL